MQDTLAALAGFAMLAIFVLIPPFGAAFIANTICPPKWKEKRSKARVAGFISIFVVSLGALFVLIGVASLTVFGR